jgi:hypothetical protein
VSRLWRCIEAKGWRLLRLLFIWHGEVPANSTTTQLLWLNQSIEKWGGKLYAYQRTSFKTPTLSKLCPVEAFVDWIHAAQLTSGPVFRSIDRWGHIADVGLHEDSLIPIFRTILTNAGVASADLYSGHSLRRGFATWATANGWDLKTLMEYVGWKNVQSAMRYVDVADQFSQKRIESSLSTPSPIR